jgi:hypothetical protein
MAYSTHFVLVIGKDGNVFICKNSNDTYVHYTQVDNESIGIFIVNRLNELYNA